MRYRVSRSDLNFWDSPQSIWKWHFGHKLRIFINLGLTIFVIFNGIPFLRCFIEIQGIRKIMLILLFSWNWVISYNEKCFKHYFSWNSTFFFCGFPIFSWNCNTVIAIKSKWTPEISVWNIFHCKIWLNFMKIAKLA